jgi:hypothetical protein
VTPQRLLVLAVLVVAILLCGPLAAFQVRSSTALSLVLVIDVSASVDFRTLELPRDVSDAVDSGLLSHLSNQDRFGVAGFGATTKFSGFVPGDRATRLKAVRTILKDRSIGFNGPSRLWDAIDEALTHLEGEPSPRAIILVTDGRASGNRLGSEAVVQRAKSSSVVVSVVGSGSSGSPAARDRYPEHEPHIALERLAGETGGAFFRDEFGDAFRARKRARHLEAILRQLRTGSRP